MIYVIFDWLYEEVHPVCVRRSIEDAKAVPFTKNNITARTWWVFDDDGVMISEVFYGSMRMKNRSELAECDLTNRSLDKLIVQSRYTGSAGLIEWL